jgi:segregation and condensation protein B
VNESTNSNDRPSLKEIIEALLFASDEPLSVKALSAIVAETGEDTQGWSAKEGTIRDCITQINQEYEQAARPFHVIEIAGGFQFATKARFGFWLGRMVQEKSKRKLTVSALESLAVIAYKQPVTKPEIEAIRGVNADYVLHTLLERNMIAIVGRAASPGRPLLYGTTREFLRHFGINDLSELPKPREIDELLAEAEYEVEKRLMKEQEENMAGEGDSGSFVVNEHGSLTLPRPEVKDGAKHEEAP